MVDCPHCRTRLHDDDRFCPRCGAAQAAASESPTVAFSGPSTISRPAEGMRFPSGTVLAGRYRIVGRLGRGGMGEIYRAEDVKLGTTVAVKTLTASIADSPAAIERLLDEVRHAREVSHPNVCRVHDVGEAEGVHFLTMEYVDGEDLAVLLRRIGRLSTDKAVEIARQICAGLAAAHDKGLLHRDLKPENVMIDGRGTVRITDFGLAVLADRPRPDDLRSGTPAYMAPEQLEGREATVRSDLFALGLIVQEMVTGKRVFDAKTPEEFDRQRRSFDPLITTTSLERVDPALERVVRRCLDPDPSRRPASARSVAAALPGGDPLAAAMEAGETPSPDLVAAAEADRVVSHRTAIASLAAFVALLAAIPFLGARHSVLGYSAPVRSGEALAERAREIVARVAGSGEAPRDEAHGFVESEDVLRWIERREGGAERWDLLAGGRTGAVSFWYRAHPRPLKALNPLGVVGPGNPPPYSISRSAGVTLDEGGRLVAFHRVPDQVDPEAAGPADRAAADWTPLLEATGLPRESLARSTSRWTPPVHADERAAWDCAAPELPGVPLRIEAAAYRGVPVYFEVIGPWTRPERMEEPQPLGRWDEVRIKANLLLVLVGVGAAMVLAWRNARLGRGDQRGATRMALGILAIFLCDWALRAHHQFDLEAEWDLFLQGTAIGLFLAALVWLVYLALEPMVRRRMPYALISWTRLLAGAWRDPRVGRDVLLGAVAGSACALAVGLGRAVPAWLGIDPGPPFVPAVESLNGPGGVLAVMLSASVGAVISPSLLLFLLATLRRFTRRTWVAVVVLAVVLLPLFSASGGSIPINVGFAITLLGIWLGTLVGAGFLSFVVLILVFQWLVSAPWTVSASAWWLGAAATPALAATALALLGFWVAMAGRPVLGVFDEGIER